MNKIVSFIFSVLMLLALSGCEVLSSEVSSALDSSLLEGYWMDESGRTLTFTADEILFGNGLCYSYSIYDNNKFIYHDGSDTLNYKFEITNNEILEITNLNHLYNEEDSAIYYKSEKKQEEIKRNKIAREKEEASEAEAEAERREAEAKLEKTRRAEEIIQQEYADEVSDLEDRIDLDQYSKNLVDETEADEIEIWNQRISEAQERIDLLCGNDQDALWADSYGIAVDILKEHLLPEDESYNWIFGDEGLQAFDSDTEVSFPTYPVLPFAGYCVEVRTDMGMHAPIYGRYVVQIRTGYVYSLDLTKDYPCLGRMI